MNNNLQPITYEPIIGLEVHVELKTSSKMFCGCSADYFGKEPNTHTCPVCLGLPGALPVPNRQAIEWCVMIGLALNCEIPLFSKFDRKNYFYPDLSKGYQISQYDQPFAINGSIRLGGVASQHLRGDRMGSKEIRILRVHMEEDTAKLTHSTIDGEKVSLIDFNRSGVPLIEIVTEPDFSSADEVVEYLKKLQQIIRYLGVSDCDMEKGEMRLEPNISLIPYTSGEPSGHPRGGRMDSSGMDLPTYKVEVKNINSFRFVERAINFEIKRQAEILDKGKTPIQETRGFIATTSSTKAQRSKEEAHDYRYFPEPDIPPVHWTEYQISNIKLQMPELPDIKFMRFIKRYNLSDYDAGILTRKRALADYFEEAVRISSVILARETRPESSGDAGQASMTITPKQIANTIINKKIDIEQILPAKLIQELVLASKTEEIDPAELEKVIDSVIAQNSKAVQDFKNGKENVIMFLVGNVMRHFKQKIDAKYVYQKIKAKLQ